MPCLGAECLASKDNLNKKSSIYRNLKWDEALHTF